MTVFNSFIMRLYSMPGCETLEISSRSYTICPVTTQHFALVMFYSALCLNESC